MSLVLDANEARQSDRVSQVIKTAGKYIGTITRAEKLLSKKNTEGLGISFKSDDGATANYLDLYTVNAAGENLPSLKTVQAILCCTRTKEATEGEITFEKWDLETREMVKAKAPGYPSLMGKRIGFLFQQELSTNTNTNKDVDRVTIYAVFDADSELTASEILDKKTQPEKLEKMLVALMAHPVYDRRNKPMGNSNNPASTGSSIVGMDDDIPW